ncbi:MAG: alginate export family protein [Elusimicrobiales bacterium]|nr:alginate export family protein [Elusimicrobiales bacterium]
MDFSDAAKDKVNDVDTRVQINMGFELNDDVDAVVSAVKANRQYGNTTATPSTSNAEDANTVLDNFFFEQAYLNLKGVFGMDHKLGRQYYGEEGDLIIYYGPQGMPYNYGTFAANGLSVMGLDGWSSGYSWDKLHMGFLLAKDGNDIAGTIDDDKDIAGITAKYDMSDDMKLGAYVYQYNTQAGDAAAVTGPNDRLQVLGVKADGMFSGFKYHAELAKNMGKNNGTIYALGTTGMNDYSGMGYLVNASYEMDLAGKLTLMGEYASGSGDKNTTDDDAEAFYGIQSDYRPGILWGGFDITGTANGITDLTTWNVGAKWNPSSMEKLTLKAKLYSFAPTEDKTGTAKAYDAYGMEFDLCANWQHSENVGVKAYYAMFMPEKDYAQRNSLTAKDDVASVIGAAFNVKF